MKTYWDQFKEVVTLAASTGTPYNRKLTVGMHKVGFSANMVSPEMLEVSLSRQGVLYRWRTIDPKTKRDVVPSPPNINGTLLSFRTNMYTPIKRTMRGLAEILGIEGTGEIHDAPTNGTLWLFNPDPNFTFEGMLSAYRFGKMVNQTPGGLMRISFASHFQPANRYGTLEARLSFPFGNDSITPPDYIRKLDAAYHFMAKVKGY
jgi:hypothetical protein